jgi:cytochrome c oxidase subunit IV
MSSTHIVPKKVYFAIFGILLVLTFLTVVAAFYDLGPFSAFVAVTIACIKGALVVLYFMHVRYSDRLTWVIVITGFAWVGVLIVLTLSDYFSRGWLRG